LAVRQGDLLLLKCPREELDQAQIEGLLVCGTRDPMPLVLEHQQFIGDTGALQSRSHGADVLRGDVGIAPALDDQELALNIVYKVDRGALVVLLGICSGEPPSISSL
jgi:hypothetical protein